MKEYSTQFGETPIGIIEARASSNGLQSLRFVPAAGEDEPNTHTRAAVKQLQEYFDGNRTTFEVAFDIEGTDFQKSVWEKIALIPYGETWTYGEIASSLGKPNAFRAVGTACGRNPLWLIVPCHRVVGASGKLTGYAGGINKKMRLLEMENRAM
jgi:methylated-DNA-[protein]-cysteine S-methyltransferase